MNAPNGRGLQEDLPPEDFLRIANARRAVWTGGFQGLGAGLVLGALTFAVASRVGPYKGKLQLKKHGFMLTITGGALCSFVGALAAGKPAIASLSDIFQARQKLTPYQQRLVDAKVKELAAAEERAAAAASGLPSEDAALPTAPSSSSPPPSDSAPTHHSHAADFPFGSTGSVAFERALDAEDDEADFTPVPPAARAARAAEETVPHGSHHSHASFPFGATGSVAFENFPDEESDDDVTVMAEEARSAEAGDARSRRPLSTLRRDDRTRLRRELEAEAEASRRDR